MKFNLVTNENLEIGNNYYTLLLYHGLSDLGHTVSMTGPSGFRGHVDIVYLMYLWDKGDYVEALRGRPDGYVLFAQEIFTGDDMNGWSLPPERLSIFREAARSARFVLTPFRSTVEPLRRFNPRVAYCPLSFHPAVDRVRLASEPSFDVFFFGSFDRAGRRHALIRRLNGRGLGTALLGLGGPLVQRDALIGASRLCINLPPPPPMDHASPRVPLLANNRACCVSPRVADPDGYLAFASVFDGEDAFVEGCVEIVRDGSYRARGLAAYEALRARPGFTEVLADALDAAA